MTASTGRTDQFFMAIAIDLAIHAQRSGERPFGCVVVDPDGDLIGLGKGSERYNDPTCHSEIAAIKQACATRDGLLQGCTLVSTHEPCAMCCGAINHSKVSRVVWGSDRADLSDLFRARMTGGIELLSDTSHPPELVWGVMRDECVSLFEAELRAARAAA